MVLEFSGKQLTKNLETEVSCLHQHQVGRSFGAKPCTGSSWQPYPLWHCIECYHCYLYCQVCSLINAGLEQWLTPDASSVEYVQSQSWVPTTSRISTSHRNVHNFTAKLLHFYGCWERASQLLGCINCWCRLRKAVDLPVSIIGQMWPWKTDILARYNFNYPGLFLVKKVPWSCPRLLVTKYVLTTPYKKFLLWSCDAWSESNEACIP